MRSILTVLMIAGLTGPAFAAEPTPAQKQTRAQQIAEFTARCAYQAEQAVKRDAPKGPMRLTEAPPARMERAVNRRINGCPVPVIVRNGVELR